MAEKPISEFGKRRPAAIPAPPPVKRSHHVALLLMGTLAVGGSAYALMPGESCQPGAPGMASAGADCSSRGSSSSGGRGASGGTSSRSSFFSGGSPSNAAASGATSEASSGNVTRGGFGSFARAFSAHFSGGG